MIESRNHKIKMIFASEKKSNKRTSGLSFFNVATYIKLLFRVQRKSGKDNGHKLLNMFIRKQIKKIKSKSVDSKINKFNSM